MRISTRFFFSACMAFAATTQIGAQSLAQTFFYDGLYYEQTDEMRVKLIPSPGEKYTGKISVPNCFNVATVDSEGKTIINSYFVMEVAAEAFDGCEGVSSVEFNGTTTKFGAHAFRGCTSLRKIELPTSFATDTELGEGTFEGCTSLSEVVFGNHVAALPAKAFAGCDDLSALTIAAIEPPAIAADAFSATNYSECKINVPKSSLAAYKAADGWKEFETISAISEYSFVSDGIYYLIDEMNPKKVKVTLDGYGSYTGDVVLPEYVTNAGTTYTVGEIGRDAFRGSSELTSVTLPETIANLGINAFQGCSKLESVNIPDAIGTLPENLFRDCTSLKSFIIPDGIGRVMGNTFRGCTSLEDVTFGKEVYIIGAYAFADCVNLKRFVASEKMSMIGDYAFMNCTSLEEITGTPTWDYWYAKGTFAGCDNIKTINIPVANPPRCPNENMFTQEVYDNATLIVPEGSVESYRESVHGDANIPDVWQKFQHIIGSESGIETIVSTPSCTPAAYINLQGQSVTHPEKGHLYIRLTNGKAEKVIY